MWAFISGNDQPGEQGGEMQPMVQSSKRHMRTRKWKKGRRNKGESNESKKDFKMQTNVISTGEVTFHLKLHSLWSQSGISMAC